MIENKKLRTKKGITLIALVVTIKFNETSNIDIKSQIENRVNR